MSSSGTPFRRGETVPFSSPRGSQKAFEEICKALSVDMPLLMHGSGDVPPSAVNRDTVAIVSKLTAQYVSHLVDAAVQAHDILTDGAGGLLPPPPPVSKRAPSVPPAPDKAAYPGADLKKRKRKRGGIDYCDDPLPQPKIRTEIAAAAAKASTGVPGQTAAAAAAAGTKTTDSSKKSGAALDSKLTGTSSTKGKQNTAGSSSIKETGFDANGIHADQWVGLSGVDFFESSRTRTVHVNTPAAIGTQCFIFPICHDAQLYGRVKELQAARRSLAPELLDRSLMDIVQEEGKTKRKTKRGDKDADDDNDDDDEEHRPVWPGLEDMLPTHRGF